MKLEAILKSQGYTDADIAAMSTLLSDQRFRSSMEAQFATVVTERDAWKQRSEEYENLRETEYLPAVTNAQQEAQKVRLELAEANEKLRIAKDYGYLDGDAQREADEAAAKLRNQPGQPGNFDPKAHKLVTYDDIAGYALKEGDAIVMANDLSEEYRMLTGKSILEYQGSNGQRGMRALLAEARGAKQNIDVYVENKFDFAGKRQAAAQKREQEREEAIRRDEREKIALQQPMNGNPMTGRPMLSRAPFIPTPDPAKNGQPVFPWDAPTRQSERIERAFKTQVSSRTN